MAAAPPRDDAIDGSGRQHAGQHAAAVGMAGHHMPGRVGQGRRLVGLAIPEGLQDRHFQRQLQSDGHRDCSTHRTSRAPCVAQELPAHDGRTSVQRGRQTHIALKTAGLSQQQRLRQRPCDKPGQRGRWPHAGGPSPGRHHRASPQVALKVRCIHMHECGGPPAPQLKPLRMKGGLCLFRWMPQRMALPQGFRRQASEPSPTVCAVGPPYPPCGCAGQRPGQGQCRPAQPTQWAGAARVVQPNTARHSARIDCRASSSTSGANCVASSFRRAWC